MKRNFGRAAEPTSPLRSVSVGSFIARNCQGARWPRQRRRGSCRERGDSAVAKQVNAVPYQQAERAAAGNSIAAWTPAINEASVLNIRRAYWERPL